MRGRGARETKGADQAEEGLGLLALIGDVLAGRRAAGYLVGGAVRDSLLGRPAHNLDMVVRDIRPAHLARILHERHGFTGPVVFKRAGAVFTRRGGTEVEIGPLKGSLEEDSLGRDFTVNCLYLRIRPGLRTVARRSVLDPTGEGLRDLDARVLRAYPDCFTPMAGDPLRLLRAVRLRATHGFSIEQPLRAAIPRMAFLISRPARERVRGELERILLSGRAASSLRLMQRTGLLEMVLPEVSATAGFEQGSAYHAYDLLTHTLKTISFVRRDLRLRLAALLHDTGKPGARRRKGNRYVYYGHERLSAALARSALVRLRFPRATVDDVVFLIENHMVNYSPYWTDAAVRRFMRRMGDRLDPLLDLAEADRKAHAPAVRMGASVKDLGKRIKDVELRMRSRDASFEAPMDGRSIMRSLGIPEGPEVGRAKEYLCQVVLRRGRPLKEEEAVRLLRRWAAAGPDPESG